MSNKIALTAVIYDNVVLGQDVVIEDQCIIGVPIKNSNALTVIGNRAHIRAGTIIYQGNRIGDDFQSGNRANIRENNTIGARVSVGTLSVVEHQVILEDDVRLHTCTFIPEYSHLKRGCWIGPHAVLTNAKYPSSPGAKANLRGPVIGESAVVGANCTILPGVEIGARALVGAAAVVVRSVADDEVVVGNPAVKIGERAQLPYGRGDL